MKKIWIRIEIILVCSLWLGLSVFSWLKPADEFSISERRRLDQFPKLNLATIGDGSFMSNFEDYTLDQFPLRDTFRTVKALSAFGLFLQKDNNNIYIADGQAASLDYPLSESSLNYASGRIQALYEKYFKDIDANFYFSIVPDKGYYLAQANGYPAMDYAALTEAAGEIFSFAEYIDIFGTLDAGDYYATDSHWKQENLEDTVSVLADGMGISGKIWKDYETVTASQPFYGVYYGQAALPLAPDTIRYLTNDALEACTVYNVETGKTGGIYDLEKLDSRDPYEVFLSGATPLLIVENPNAAEERELVVFRDSYGSSLLPLLTGAYSRIVIADTRYMHPDLLASHVDFSTADDVLFLYSTSLLNSSRPLK